jgi:acetoin utilization deacetylase AcuC-like enzyme
MKPHRLTLTNALVFGYGLDKQIHHIYDPRPATQAELEAYHDHDYIEFLSKYDFAIFSLTQHAYSGSATYPIGSPRRTRTSSGRL